MEKIEVAAAIIINDRQIFCMEGKNLGHEHISRKFLFPGGRIENGERRIDALIRELRDELNLTAEVSDENFFFTVHHTYPDFQLTMHTYICHVDSQDFVPKEVVHKWVGLDQLKSVDWAGADIPIIDRLLELKEDELR